jgi:acetyl-CoA carboxylase biotin carboxylase subunit
MMKEAGVPVIPGSEGVIKNLEEAQQMAAEMGYPLLIKAAGGGGGKGMRVATNDEELKKGYEMAKMEAEAAFGNPEVYIEKYILNPRHIEFQIMGDSQGNLIHLGERDCTIQRRHQKLIEESPSPALTTSLRVDMGRASVVGASRIGYESVGTIEFLLDKNGNFYFMEMNTRIQVEHPVTEEVTGIDLLKEQIKIAAGEKLSRTQEEIILKGHAIECRINAEDPEKDFMPSPGLIKSFHVPGGHGIRVDTHAYAGYEIPPYYDSLVAKLISVADTREESILKMRRALDEFILEGIKTTIPFYKKVFSNPNFISGEYDTSFVESLFKENSKEKVSV